MSTPKSSKELFESLRQLRSDPLVAAVLRGDGEQQDSRLGTEVIAHGGHRESSPPTQSAYLQQVPSNNRDRTHAATTADELRHIALAHESNQFLRNRDATRASVGVNNWVHNHRGEVDAAEARRVENRLKAEKMFAQTQLDVEKFRLEHQYRKSLDIEKQRPQTEHAEQHNARLDFGEDEQQEISGSSPVKQTQTTPPDAALEATAQPHAYHPVSTTNALPARLQHVGGDAPLSFLSPFHSEIQRFHTTASPQLNTDEFYGPVDEDENYRVKALAVATSYEGANALTDPYTNLRKDKNEDMFARNDELAALRDAVEQRDRTIKRLERQLAQDRDYYEQEVQRYKSDAHEERIASEGRVTALRAQIDQLVSSRAGRNAHETTIEEMTVKLQAVQRMYRESIDDIRRAAATRNELLERTCEERIKDVSQRAEDAIRQAKETYRVDRSEYLTSQKDRLVELVQREQNLLLREAEASLKSVVEVSVREKLITEIELAFRKHLQADILPALRDQIRVDATAEVLKEATTSADGIFASKALELRNLLQEHCTGMQATMVSRFQTTAEQILRSVHHQPSSAGSGGAKQSNDPSSENGSGVDAITISSTATVQLRQTHIALNAAIEKTIAEEGRQQKLEELHGEKMAVYRRRMDQIEGALESEKQFADAIRQQVAQTNTCATTTTTAQTATTMTATTSGSFPRRAVHVSSESDSGAAPPWVTSLAS